MAESTVSGPFRSENGFQQLDENGEWVPVTGGGGGGVTSIVAGSGISVSSPTGAVTISATGGGGGSSTAILFTPPTDGTTVDVVLPAPAAVGQIYTISSIFSPFTTPNGVISINPVLLPEQDFPVFQLIISEPPNLIYSYGDDGPYEFTADGLFGTLITIVYTGEVEVGGFKFALYYGSQTIRYYG